MTNPGEFHAQLDQWIERAGTHNEDRLAEARRSIAIDKQHPPVLFGAGELGVKVLRGLRGFGIEPLCFVDNNPKRWRTELDGIAIVSLADAVERHGRGVPIVMTVYTSAELEARLLAAGLSVTTFPQLASAFSDALLPLGALELPSLMPKHQRRIHEAFELWEDQLSREEFVAQIKFRATFSGPLPPHLPAQSTYFGYPVATREDECFVDCGAFNGDSIDSFLRRSGGWFDRIVAIEPDPVNASSLRAYVASLTPSASSKIAVVESAVGARNEMVRFSATGTVTSAVDDLAATVEVRCRTLDTILQDYRPTYIKMDLEGAEPDALAGAHEVVRRHAPVMALSLYHRQSDLWEIPLQLSAMSDRYQFFLRRHSDDCWEQVLYAIPKERARGE